LDRQRVLFVVAHRSVEKRLCPSLEQRYDVAVVGLRREALAYLEHEPPDLVLVDVGSIRFDVARFFEAFDDLPVPLNTFLLLGKGMRLDQMPKANGYLRHPFTTRHLMHRLSRVLPDSPRDTVAWRHLCLDKENHFLIWDGQQTPLTPKQADLALVFMSSPETVISREQLMKQVWGTDYMGDTRTLDVHIHWLRGALEEVEAPFVIETKRGVGYRLMGPPVASDEADL
jgi:DNA-binding response OmpR family regulator